MWPTQVKTMAGRKISFVTPRKFNELIDIVVANIIGSVAIPIEFEL